MIPLEIDESKIAAMVELFDGERDRQDAWLGFFEDRLSPRCACSKTDVTMKEYRQWRRHSPYFCSEYNERIREATEELQSAVYIRACESSDSLASSLLGLKERKELTGADNYVEIQIVSKEKVIEDER